jgi:hypothetical protein
MTLESNTAADVRVYADSTGFVAAAIAGTTIPTDATSSLAAAFHSLGYIDENGVVESQGTSSTKVKAWQGSAIVRTVRTEHSLTYKFAALETNAAVMREFYNQSIYDGAVEITGAQRAAGRWVIHAVDGSDLVRIVIPSGQIDTVGDVEYSTNPTKYEFTIECYPDTSGVKAYKYLSGPDS